MNGKSNRLRKLALWSLATSLVVLSVVALTDAAEALPHDLRWVAYPDDRGMALIEYDGGTLSELEDDLELYGCGLKALWIYDSGVWSFYHEDAPAFLVAPFMASYAQDIPADQALYVQCRLPEQVVRQPDSSDIPDYDLGETHIQWITNPVINSARNKQGTATIQYGGGSFYKLVSRLAVEGCEVINLNIEGTEYDFKKSGDDNHEFTLRYDGHIPKNTDVRVLCVDNCSIFYGGDLSNDDDPQRRFRIESLIEAVERNPASRCTLGVIGGYADIISSTDCNDDWLNATRQLLSLVPLYQDVCKVVHISRSHGWGQASSGMLIWHGNLMYQVTRAQIDLIAVEGGWESSFERDAQLLFTTFHELCHIHQSWYTFKEHVNSDYLQDNDIEKELTTMSELWYETPMAEEFIEMVKFLRDEKGKWILGGSIQARNSYIASDPIEMAADVCALYTLMVVAPDYAYARSYTKPPYLTDDLERWVEKYVVVANDDAE